MGIQESSSAKQDPRAGMVKTCFGGSRSKPPDMGSFDWTENTVADATPPTENVSESRPRDRGPKYRIGFSLGNQGILSILVATTSTAFTTIYSALLVFITQTLSMRRDLQIHQPLTAVRDNAAAWQGLGSAFLCLWRQMAVPASISGVRSAFFFLGNIALLQIAMPNIFVVQTIWVNRSVVVETQGLPSYPISYHDTLDSSDPWTAFARGSLYSLPSILWNATTFGLHSEGSLYDVPGPTNTAIGNITINATGFKMTFSSGSESVYPHDFTGSDVESSRHHRSSSRSSISSNVLPLNSMEISDDEDDLGLKSGLNAAYKHTLESEPTPAMYIGLGANTEPP
ncbi:hypothetical protein K438DRAFT_1786321 [Mycena galopus ATCC 62051]|nr:hypothetical protein K438DRAFT_1786321 [Mycena galopus ATCC 62051]